MQCSQWLPSIKERTQQLLYLRYFTNICFLKQLGFKLCLFDLRYGAIFMTYSFMLIVPLSLVCLFLLSFFVYNYYYPNAWVQQHDATNKIHRPVLNSLVLGVDYLGDLLIICCLYFILNLLIRYWNTS